MNITHNATLSTLVGLAFSASLGLAFAPAAMAQYSFTNFDGPVTPGATVVSTTIDGLSNSGQVVGFTTDNAGNILNFRGTPGSFTTLNIPSGGIANGLNTSNQVVGMNGTGAFTLNSASASDTTLPLPPVNGTTASIAAFGINDNGVIVGQYSDSATGLTPGFVDVNGKYTTLSALAAATGALVVNAQGISDNGLVTGFYAANTNGANQHGFLYDLNTNATTILVDPRTVQTGSNDSNLALTQFLGINDAGEAVGYYQTKDTGSQFGFLFNTKTDTYTYLNDPLAAANFAGTQITQITGINNAGEIDGFYVDANGNQRGFLANPAAVPEASSVLSFGLLLTFGLGAFLLRHKHIKCA